MLLLVVVREHSWELVDVDFTESPDDEHDDEADTQQTSLASLFELFPLSIELLDLVASALWM